MSICVVDGGPCQCQPSEGFPCPGVTRLREQVAALTVEYDHAVEQAAKNCDEVLQLREYLDAAQRRGEELRAQVAALTENGPPMQRGTTIEGTPWMGTMREVLEDYKSAADTEARWGDEARAEVAGLRESIAESLRLLGTDPKSARAVLLDAVRVDSRTLQAQGAGLESTYDVKVAPVVHYSYRCYSCDTRWECECWCTVLTA